MNEQDIYTDQPDEGSAGTGLLLSGPQLPDTLYIIPVHNRPFFPGQVLPVILNEEPWAETLELVGNTEHKSLALFFVEQPLGDPRHFDPSQLPTSASERIFSMDI